MKNKVKNIIRITKISLSNNIIYNRLNSKYRNLTIFLAVIVGWMILVYVAQGMTKGARLGGSVNVVFRLFSFIESYIFLFSLVITIPLIYLLKMLIRKTFDFLYNIPYRYGEIVVSQLILLQLIVVLVMIYIETSVIVAFQGLNSAGLTIILLTVSTQIVVSCFVLIAGILTENFILKKTSIVRSTIFELIFSFLIPSIIYILYFVIISVDPEMYIILIVIMVISNPFLIYTALKLDYSIKFLSRFPDRQLKSFNAGRKGDLKSFVLNILIESTSAISEGLAAMILVLAILMKVGEFKSSIPAALNMLLIPVLLIPSGIGMNYLEWIMIHDPAWKKKVFGALSVSSAILLLISMIVVIHLSLADIADILVISICFIITQILEAQINIPIGNKQENSFTFFLTYSFISGILWMLLCWVKSVWL